MSKTKNHSKVITIISALLISSILLQAQPSKKIAPEKPKLIVGINISQLRNDFISKYWDNLSDNGIKRLVTRGTYCKNTKLNYPNTEHGVGISTIVTGAVPAEHGIIAQNWYSPLKEKMINCIKDESIKTIGGAYQNGQYSPHQLFCTTFSDEIKLANQFRSKVYSVSMIPESAILSGGHTGNAAFWFDNQNGTFITSNYYMDSLPAWVDTFNVKKLPDTYLEKTWEMLLPQEQYKTGIKDKSKYEKGIRKQNQFPYEIEKLAKKVNRKEIYEVLNYTPYGNNLTKDFAIQVIANEELGKDDFTDVLLINFTATEYISSHYGILSFELEDMILRLDRELEHFFKFIDSFVGIENTLIYLTAENGIGYHPDYLQDNHIPSGTFSTNSSGLLLKSYLNNLYGKGDWIMDFSNGQIFLNTNLVADSDIELSELQQSIADFLIQFHGIKHTVTASTLRETHFNNGVNYKIQNGYNKKRSGHVFYTLRDGWIEVNSKKEVLKSYDATVPLLWYGWKIKRESILTPVYLDDIAPTVNILLEVNPPNAATGEPISEMFK